MAQTYKDWGKFEEAMECLEKALALDAENPHAWHLRGLVYHGAGKHYKAQTEYGIQ